MTADEWGRIAFQVLIAQGVDWWVAFQAAGEYGERMAKAMEGKDG